MWSNEACFTHDGVFNVHNRHLLTWDNPHAICECGYLVRLSISVSAEIVVGPHLLLGRLPAQQCRDFLEAVTLRLFEVVPLAARQRLWFQHDELQRTVRDEV
jgi:hypothetical protein